VDSVQDLGEILNRVQFTTAPGHVGSGICTPSIIGAVEPARFLPKFPLFLSAYYYYWFYMFFIWYKG